MLGTRAVLLALAIAGIILAGSPAAPAGVANFGQVDDGLYRGGQPTGEGFRNLRKHGVTTVIDLRGNHVDDERRMVEAAGMKHVDIPLASLSAPTDEEIARVLDIIDRERQAGGAVFVHCRRGKDRTGTVVACYRISRGGWTNRKALEEAKIHGMSNLERGMVRYILNYQPRSTKAP